MDILTANLETGKIFEIGGKPFRHGIPFVCPLCGKHKVIPESFCPPRPPKGH